MNDHEAADAARRPPAGFAEARGVDPGDDPRSPRRRPSAGWSQVWPDPGYPQHHPVERPAFWLSDDPATGAQWARCRAGHATSGLWPVLLDDSAQPWSAGQVAPEPVAEIDSYDAAAFMAEVWSGWAHLNAGDDFAAPFGAGCPGLAPPGRPREDPDRLAEATADLLATGDCLLGLVAVERGADAPAVMGWQGAINHNVLTAPLSAVLRSWEARFGVRVVRVGFNTLDMSVAAPPVTMRDAVHVAAEHWTFCPDSVVFQGPGTLAGYAEEIRGRAMWSFWWD